MGAARSNRKGGQVGTTTTTSSSASASSTTTTTKTSCCRFRKWMYLCSVIPLIGMIRFVRIPVDRVLPVEQQSTLPLVTNDDDRSHNNNPQSSSSSSSSSSSLSVSPAVSSSTPSAVPTTTTATTTKKSFRTEFFSSCLIVKDENHRLPEWLAYHYYMLPLRNLVVFVDPHSNTSPAEILQRWKPYLDDLEIWSEHNLEASTTTRTTRTTTTTTTAAADTDTDEGNDPEKNTTATKQHFQRQRLFYKTCANYFRQKNQAWTTFHDVDEYLYLDPELVPDAIARMAQPGSIQTFLHEVQQQQQPSSESQFNVPPSYRTKPCIMVSRTQFGAQEEEGEPPAAVWHIAPNYLNVSQFETLRFLHRASHHDMEVNGRGKSLVHVSQASDSEWSNFNPRGIHSILQKTCRPPSPKFSPIRIRHYLGTWEQHSLQRLDPRAGTIHRNAQWYEYRSQLGSWNPPDTSIQEWLRGFCKLMDHNRTLIQLLLQGAGQLPKQQQSQQQTWNLSPFIMEEQIDRNGEKPGTFGYWLKQHYTIDNLPNGTLVAVRIQKQQPPQPPPL